MALLKWCYMSAIKILPLALLLLPLGTGPARSEERPKTCQPEASNDCRIKDPLIIKEGRLLLQWNDLQIDVRRIPQNSWYQIPKNSPDEYLLVLYPDVGEHDLLGRHDFGVELKIQRSDRPAKTIQCTAVKADPAFSDQNYRNGPFDLEVRERVNYFYHGSPGSNPNPFTPEVREILQNLIGSMRIGKCPK